LALSARQETDLVTKLEEMFQSALEHPAWQEWRSTIAPKCYHYSEGDQWTASERKTLKKRRQHETLNNQVSVTIAKGSSLELNTCGNLFNLVFELSLLPS
jgi:hypothetical protein